MIRRITEIPYITIHEDDTAERDGVVLYRITSDKPRRDGGVDIGNDVYVAKNASIGNWVSIGNGANIGNCASIGSSASIGSGARIGNWAEIRTQYDIRTIGNMGGRNATLTIYRRNDNVMMFGTGCFIGDTEAFLAAVEEEHGDNEHGIAYRKTVEWAKESMWLAFEEVKS